MKKIFYLSLIMLTSIILCGCIDESNASKKGVTFQFYDSGAFCTLKSIDLDETYYINNKLKATVVIPKTYNGKPVTAIKLDSFSKDFAFVEKIKFGKNISNISLNNSSFPDLMEVSVSSNRNFISIDGALYTKDNKELLLWPNAKTFDNVVLPQGLENIYPLAFYCNNIKSLTIPSSIMYIQSFAFNNSLQLEKVFFEDNSQLKIIHNYAFADCKKLTEVTLPNNCNLDVIYDYAFRDCTKLNKINIPNSVTSINFCAFKDCRQLTSVTINKESKLQKIDALAFAGCEIDSIYLPYGLSYIGSCAFESCKELKSIDIPDSVTWLGDAVFNKCSSLEYVKLPKYLENIPSCTFSKCTNLTTVVLPESLKGISNSVFSECTNLKKIILLGTLEQWNNVSIQSDNDILTSGNIEISESIN